MKKTVTALAILASASVSSALIRPPTGPNPPLPPKVNTYCFKLAQEQDGSAVAGSCDQSANNLRKRAKLSDNGCAEGQVALRTTAKLAVASCLPPGVVQL